MNSIKKAILYGFIVWLIPFLNSFLFYSREGNLVIKLMFYKSIMIVVGISTGVILIIKYFKNVHNNYLKEGVLLGVIWLIMNWLLDFVILIPISKMSIENYIYEIGLRYLCMPILTIAFGYMLQVKSVTNSNN